MGKTEKIVVLTVLFAIVVLFVWSLDQGEPRAAEEQGGGAPAGVGADPGRPTGRTADPKSPRPGAEGAPQTLASRVDGGLGVTTPVIQVRPHAGDAEQPTAAPLLSAEVGVTTGVAARRPVSPTAMRGEWDLVTVAGLETTPDDELFLARARATDTWEALAERFYADATKARVLRRANEGTALAEGVDVFVPAIDRLPRTPEVREVEVLEGEGLWNVAKRALGSGSRWTELHEANRDRIVDPDFVKPGTLLRLP